MQGNGGMNEIMRQAARMRRRMDEIREAMKDQEVTAASAGGKIDVTASYEGKLRSIRIDPEFLAAEGLEFALDAVVAAANSALGTAEERMQAELSKATGGIKIPGLFG
ncbi:MAG: YbaB/EbfC family nucleoid-associated protein [Myxococcales bacterium]|nr:YbaB/EbfC family nucleoid-associated protein [Myxococcales bacterium]